VRGGLLGAAGAWGSVCPRRLSGVGARPLNFTARSRLLWRSANLRRREYAGR